MNMSKKLRDLKSIKTGEDFQFHATNDIYIWGYKMSDDYIIYLLIALLVIFVISDHVSYSNDDYEGYVFGAAVSDKSTYQVNLSSGVEYEFIVVEKALCGPLIIDVSISNGSYVPF